MRPQESDYLLPITESSYDEFIESDLLSYLLKNYSISQERGRHAIGGISRGATWALKIGLNAWEDFGTIGLHSYPGGINSSILWLKKIPEESWPNIRMDSGDFDFYLNNAQSLDAEFVEVFYTT